MINFIRKFFDVVAYRKRINTLENELETLKDSVKTEAYKKIMAKLDEEPLTKRLKEENNNLRIKNKNLRLEVLEMKGDKNDKKRNINKVIYRGKKSNFNERKVIQLP